MYNVVQTITTSGSRTFSLPQKETCNHSAATPHLLLLSALVNYCLRSVFSDLHILNISYKWNHTICDLLWLTSSISYNIFKFIYLHCTIYQYFISVYWWRIFNHMGISFMFAHSSVDRYLRGGQKLYIKCVHQLKNAATSSKH